MLDMSAGNFVRVCSDNALLGISRLLLDQFSDSKEIIHLLE
jgi:hypothetical protein